MYSTRFIIAVGLTLLAGCGGGEKQPAVRAPDATARIAVQTVTVQATEWPSTFEAPGTFRARISSPLASRVMGTILEVRVREGDRVAAGQTLVRLEARELDASKRQAQAAVAEANGRISEAESAIRSATAQLELAETTHRRMEELFARKSISPQERDESMSRVRVARSAVEMARAKRQQIDDRIRQGQEAVSAVEVQLGYLEVKSPFAGLVSRRFAEPGMIASPGAPLLEVEQAGALRLEAAVPEVHLSALRVGQAVEVRFESGDPATGRVEEIAPSVDPGARSFMVKVGVAPRPDVRSGAFARAIFSTGTRRVIAVPAVGVRDQGQLRLVFVAEGETVRARMVRLGENRQGAWEVLSGVAAGERIIVPIPAGLEDGTKIGEGGAR